jgi:hypothetical protein
MSLDELKKAVAKLSTVELRELKSLVGSWLTEANQSQQKAEQARLAKFARAVRKAGLLKQIRTLRRTKPVVLPVQLSWAFNLKVSELRHALDVNVDITIGDGSVSQRDELLQKAFKADVKALQKAVLATFKQVEKMAQEHGVDDLNWEDAVLFLWEES